MGLARTMMMAVALVALAGCATVRRSASPSEVRAADQTLARWTSAALEPFADEEEFRAYLRDARHAATVRDLYWAGQHRRHRDQGDGESIVVTGSRIPARNASITNVQEAGVDEGDIVKQIDRFLVILQDGRLFSVDTGTGPGAPLRFADRVNIYRDAARDGDAWFDEMLVLGDRILITGYSYRREASELSVFRMGPDGRFAREGSFFISSGDYYDSSNYATRLVDGNLLIYTPIELNEIDPSRPISWPLIRRWQQRDEQVVAGRTRPRPQGRPMFTATSIYRPLLSTVEPVVHAVTLCPLGPEAAGRDLQCRTTAFIAGSSRQLYVSPDDAFLMLGPAYEDFKARADPSRCGADRPTPADVYPTHLMRIPVGGGPPSVLGMRGAVFDQFSLQVREGEFRALINWVSDNCVELPEDRQVPINFTLFRAPLAAFSSTFRNADDTAYTPLPSIGANLGDRIIDRFTDHHVVYGRLGQARWWRDDDAPRPTELVAVRVERPGEARRLSLPHNVIRAETAGENVVLTGYRPTGGLNVSVIDLSGLPRVGATLTLDSRIETEGRSHAFNSLVAADGSGLLGLPTVARSIREDNTRPVWRSRASDMSFLVMDRDGALSDAGLLSRSIDYSDDNRGGVPGYQCEVSCVDWYGNSRPIFTDGRTFALNGAELIEGRLEDGRIREVQRLNIALESERRPAN
ncbi:MAG TPA: beta-propeller domain-containing protein [Allosphingosinicella sp.]